jgi:hypothetical protein
VELGVDELDLAVFSARANVLFPGTGAAGSIVGDVLQQLRDHWADLLAPEGDERRVQLTTAEVARTLGERFACPGPGWPSARHHSPDILIAARDVTAIARADFIAVLGELHVGMNTVTNPVAVKEHDHPESLIAARELDLPASGIAPVWSEKRSRADFFSLSRHDFDLENGETRSARSRDRVIAVADCVVARAGDRLVVRTRDRKTSFDIIAFFEHHLIAESYSRFNLRSPRAHLPRVTIDKLTVAREEWHLSGGELPFAGPGDEVFVDLFARVRRWALARGLPRFIFARVPSEPKPIFVDLESEIFIKLFVKYAKGAPSIAISEMLPDPEHCWLRDADRNAYTSELRLAAVDPIEWSARS